MKKEKWPGKPTYLHLLLPQLEEKLASAIAEAVKDQGLKPEAIEVKRSGAVREIKALEEGSRTAQQYFTTRTLDRDNEILVPKGAIMDQFKASNMQVFWNHDYSQLIGSDERLKMDDFGWMAWTKYAKHEFLGARANLVWELKQQGHLKTNSVGFAILEATRPGNSDWNQTIDAMAKAWPEFTAKTARSVERIITKYMVIEHSDVGVPSNVNSTMLAIAKNYGAQDEDLEKMFNIEVKDFPTGDPKVKKDAEQKGDGLTEKEISLADFMEKHEAEARAWLKEKDAPEPEPLPAKAKAVKVKRADKYVPKVVKVGSVYDEKDFIERAAAVVREQIELSQGRI